MVKASFLSHENIFTPKSNMALSALALSFGDKKDQRLLGCDGCYYSSGTTRSRRDPSSVESSSIDRSTSAGTSKAKCCLIELSFLFALLCFLSFRSRPSSIVLTVFSRAGTTMPHLQTRWIRRYVVYCRHAALKLETYSTYNRYG